MIESVVRGDDDWEASDADKEFTEIKALSVDVRGKELGDGSERLMLIVAVMPVNDAGSSTVMVSKVTV